MLKLEWNPEAPACYAVYRHFPDGTYRQIARFPVPDEKFQNAARQYANIFVETLSELERVGFVDLLNYGWLPEDSGIHTHSFAAGQREDLRTYDGRR